MKPYQKLLLVVFMTQIGTLTPEIIGAQTNQVNPKF